jgi:hypothetical protein
LEEAIMLIMMRRHIWLYAIAGLVVPADLQQQVETINKTIRIFDYGIYDIVQKYNELINDNRSVSIGPETKKITTGRSVKCPACSGILRKRSFFFLTLRPAAHIKESSG